MGRIIGIVSGKGGAGKTTTAINLGLALTEHFNKKVALVDCNLTTAHIGLYLGIYITPITLNSVLQNRASLAGALYIHPSGLRIIPASLNIQDLQGIDHELFTKTIKNLSEMFDIVLLDSAPGIDREALMALKACDKVLFIANPFIPSAVDVAKIVNLSIKLTQDGVADIEPIGVLMNRVKGKDYELSESEVERLTALPIIGSIPEDESILQSVNSKTPVILSNPGSRASQAYIQLAASLVGEKPEKDKGVGRFGESFREPAIEPKEKPGLIKRFLGYFKKLGRGA
ncbi:MAG: AAA family ATPase [Candidatus Aenigmarchaeota archaeon]|nr:AAA family ATPase [Candidatus Aenigmarchaeota archaeon]